MKVYSYRGTPLANMSRDELIVVINEMNSCIQRTRTEIFFLKLAQNELENNISRLKLKKKWWL